MNKLLSDVEMLFVGILDNILSVITLSGDLILPLITILVLLATLFLPMLILLGGEWLVFRSIASKFRSSQLVLWSTVVMQVVWVFAALKFMWETLV